MPIARFQMPDGRVGRFEVPDGTTPEQAQSMISASMEQGKQDQPQKPSPIALGNWQDTLREDFNKQPATFQRAVAAGTALSNLYEGAKQLFNGEDKATVEGNKVFASERPGAALAGNLAMVAPTALIPGANTVTGAAVAGGILGALNPVSGDTYGEKMKNKAIDATIGAATAGAVQKVGNSAINAVSNKLTDLATKQSQNAINDATLEASKKAGYVIPPGMTDKPNWIARMAEGFGGKLQTQQQASSINQGVTNSLSRKALGLADDTAMSPAVMQDVRNIAFTQGYEPVKKMGMVQVDNDFKNGLQKIVDDHVTAARDFGEVADDPVLKLVKDVGDKVLSTGAFDAKSGLAKIKLLREDASKYYASGDKTLGKATKEAATQLEDLIERNLSAQGNDGAQLLQKFRDARKLMAKTYSVEKSLNQGTGDVIAGKLAGQLTRGKPLSDELLDVAKFGQSYPKAAQNVATIGSQPGISPLDFVSGGIYAGVGAAGGGAMGGGEGAGLGSLAGLLPLLRGPTRNALLSQKLQQLLIHPQSYQLSLADLLKRGAGKSIVASSGYLPAAAAQGAITSLSQ